MGFFLCWLFFVFFYQCFRERDELLGALRAVRASQQEAQQREWSACLQVKQAVEMAEEANLYKARVRETYYAHLSSCVGSLTQFLRCPLKWLVTSVKPVCMHAGGGAVWAAVQGAGSTEGTARTRSTGLTGETGWGQRRGPGWGTQTERGAGAHSKSYFFTFCVCIKEYCLCTVCSSNPKFWMLWNTELYLNKNDVEQPPQGNMLMFGNSMKLHFCYLIAYTVTNKIVKRLNKNCHYTSTPSS